MQIIELENRKIFWLDFAGKEKALLANIWLAHQMQYPNIHVLWNCVLLLGNTTTNIMCSKLLQFDQSISNPQRDEMNWWLHFHARAIFQWPNTPTFHFCIHFLKCWQCWMQFYNINNPRTSISKVFIHISFSFCSRTTSFLIDDAHKMLHKILTSVCLEYAWVWDVLTAHYAHY